MQRIALFLFIVLSFYSPNLFGEEAEFGSILSYRLSDIPEEVRQFRSVQCPDGEYITGLEAMTSASLLGMASEITKVKCSSSETVVDLPGAERTEGDSDLAFSEREVLQCPNGFVVIGIEGIVPRSNELRLPFIGVTFWRVFCQKQEHGVLSESYETPVTTIDADTAGPQRRSCPAQAALSELFFLILGTREGGISIGISGGYCRTVGEGSSPTTTLLGNMRLPTKGELQEDIEEGREEGAEGWVEEENGEVVDEGTEGENSDGEGNSENEDPPVLACEEGFELNSYGVCREIDSSEGEGVSSADTSGDNGDDEDAGDLPLSDEEGQKVDEEKDESTEELIGNGSSGCSLIAGSKETPFNESLFVFSLFGLLFLRFLWGRVCIGKFFILLTLCCLSATSLQAQAVDPNAVEPFGPVMDMQTWNDLPEYARPQPEHVVCPIGEFITGFEVIHGASIMFSGFNITKIHCSSRDFSPPLPGGGISEEGRRLLTTSDFRCPEGSAVTGLRGLIPKAGSGLGAALLGLEMVCDDRVSIKVIDPGAQFNSLLETQESFCSRSLALSEIFINFYDRRFFGFSSGYCSYVGGGSPLATTFSESMRLPTKEDIRRDLEEGREQGAEGWVEEENGEVVDEGAEGENSDGEGNSENEDPPAPACEEGFELNSYGVCREIDSSEGDDAGDGDAGEEDGDLPPSDEEGQNVDDEKEDATQELTGSGGSGCSLQSNVNPSGFSFELWMFLLFLFVLFRVLPHSKIPFWVSLFILLGTASKSFAQTNTCGGAENNGCLPSLIIVPLEASDEVLGYRSSPSNTEHLIGRVTDHRLTQTAACKIGAFIEGISIQKSPHGEIYVIRKVSCSDGQVFSWDYPRFASSEESTDRRKYQLQGDEINISCPKGHVVSGFEGVMPLLSKEALDLIRKQKEISLVEYADTFPPFGGFHSLRLLCSKKESWGINGSYTAVSDVRGYYPPSLGLGYDHQWWKALEFEVRSKTVMCPPGTALETMDGIFGSSLFHGIGGGVCASGNETPPPPPSAVQFSNETHLSPVALLSIEDPKEVVANAAPNEVLGGYECLPGFAMRGFRVFMDEERLNHVAPLCSLTSYISLGLSSRLESLSPPKINYLKAEGETKRDILCPYGYLAYGMQFQMDEGFMNGLRVACLHANWYAPKIEEMVTTNEAVVTVLVGNEVGEQQQGEYFCPLGELPVGWVIRATKKGKEMRGVCRNISIVNPLANTLGGFFSNVQVGDEAGESEENSTSFQEIISDFIAPALSQVVEENEDDLIEDPPAPPPPTCEEGFELNSYGVCHVINADDESVDEVGEEKDGDLPSSDEEGQNVDDEKEDATQELTGSGGSGCSLQLGSVSSVGPFDFIEFFPILVVGLWILRRRLS